LATKNPLIKKAGDDSSLTEDQALEYTKCFSDPLYFIENYIYVRHPVKGQTLFKLYDYQQELVAMYNNNKDVIVRWSRQAGKSEVSCAYLFWFSVFRKDKTILIASNKHKNSRAMISRIKFMYEKMPMWLKPGVKDDGWNALSLKFDNGSVIESDATSETTGRGGSFSILYLDEVGFVPPKMQEMMWASISPTLATGGKLFITSTPNGDSDLFATLWRGAESGTNGFAFHKILWNQVPGRDDEFKRKEISKNGVLTWRQEFEVEFLSSEPLLISSLFAQTLKPTDPVDVNHGIKIWKNFSKDYNSDAMAKRDPHENQTADLYNYQRAEQAAPEKVYNKQCIVTCDPSKGLGGDYTVINVVEYPSLVQMMEFRSNISQTAEVYKILRYIWKKADEAGWECMFTVENNSVGEGIIILYETDEKIPNNVNMVSDSGKQLGMNTNARTKLQSCKTFKEMVEAGKFTINSADTIREIKTFVQTKGSYAAQPGGHDDTISAWLLVCRVLQEIASYDADAFQALYEVGELGDELVDDSDDFDDMPMVF
jgi:ATP-dependent Clp protease adapter protein ClpS